MEVKLRPFDFAQAAARAGLSVNGTPLASGVARTAATAATAASATSAPAPVGKNFGDAMVQALKSVSSQQQEVARLQREVQLDNPTVSLEETMVAMQKAQIGFQATLQVRNRLVSAYSEIMNMQI